ncbi:MAG: type II toxin-antitoxin system RelE/ParE family toxin [Betaproteobacteria bacterium]|nr:type II toxin-antitoxin system RelE/ParE family toxin [Betaproteobacteria bacterium]
MDYTRSKFDVVQSETFASWLSKLRDRQAVARINARIRRVSESGNFGDTKVLREGVSEMRIDHGPGYRLYFMRRGAVVVVLLAGGEKSTQDADIKRAIAILKEWKD